MPVVRHTTSRIVGTAAIRPTLTTMSCISVPNFAGSLCIPVSITKNSRKPQTADEVNLTTLIADLVSNSSPGAALISTASVHDGATGDILADALGNIFLTGDLIGAGALLPESALEGVRNDAVILHVDANPCQSVKSDSAGTLRARLKKFCRLQARRNVSGL